MAISPKNLYPSRVIDGDGAYPYGKALNVQNGVEGTGTPLEAEWLNDIWGSQQALLADVGIAPNGQPDSVGNSQYLDALKKLIREPLELKIFQSPSSGGLTEIQTRTVNGGKVYEVRKTSDDSLATIYSDAAGTAEIVQNGTSNVSGSDGVVEFFIAEGDYYVEVGGVSAGFVVGSIADGLAETQRVMRKLKNGEDANIVVFSDSTGDATDEWVYKLAEKLAGDFSNLTVFYRLWDSGAGNYAARVTVQSAGSQVLTIWNAAIAGSNANRFCGSEFNAAARPSQVGGSPDLYFVNYGHNGGNQLERQYSMHSQLISLLVEFSSDSPVIIIGQNPVLSDDSMQRKVEVFQKIARVYGCGYIDINSYFLENLNPLADYYKDDVHPNETGSEVWAQLVHDKFRYNKDLASATTQSGNKSQAYSVLDTFNQMLRVSSSTANVTLERYGVNFETSGQSLKMTGNGVASPTPFAYFDVIDSKDIRSFIGKTICINVRLKTDVGAGALTGRIAAYDGIQTITSTNGGESGGRYIDQSMIITVDSAATYLRVYVYIDASTPSDSVYIDRIVTSFDRDIAEGTSLSRIDAAEFISIFGAGGVNGNLVVGNSTSNGRAISVLDLISGDIDDDPNTQYVASVSANGVEVKQRGDTFPRVHINTSGLIQLSKGASGFTTYIDSPLDNNIRIGTANVYPSVDATYDIGIGGYTWRRLQLSDGVFVGGTKVTGSQQVAISDSVGGDESAKINSILAALRAHGLIAT
ncbi:tail fiber protein [Pseudoalteromonas phage H101]|uniref:SGNH hydrolase-type esterase domain-containing protein n=1 Tax=Pseudoalteromonas phage H101 TaxID=1654919 RepID=A0A0H4J203_9CAUD|nr:tail fiber protein [Pseudoalteromonas phage H101]AKO60925.1 hypothetical protein [Pseudoalteromonas phage H101]